MTLLYIFFLIYSRRLYKYPCSYLDRIIPFRDSDISFRSVILGVPFRPVIQYIRREIHCFVLDYSLSDGGRWSKMKVSFLVSSQSILKRLSRNFATIMIII